MIWVMGSFGILGGELIMSGLLIWGDFYFRSCGILWIITDLPSSFSFFLESGFLPLVRSTKSLSFFPNRRPTGFFSEWKIFHNRLVVRMLCAKLSMCKSSKIDPTNSKDDTSSNIPEHTKMLKLESSYDHNNMSEVSIKP